MPGQTSRSFYGLSRLRMPPSQTYRKGHQHLALLWRNGTMETSLGGMVQNGALSLRIGKSGDEKLLEVYQLGICLKPFSSLPVASGPSLQHFCSGTLRATRSRRNNE